MTDRVSHPGPNEIEWLADLKTVAERVGKEVMGHPVRWRVETRVGKSGKRSDVLVEKASDGLLFSGEAKRPDDPAGINPLVAGEVDVAVEKAQRHGVKVCFTTNFHQIAVFNAGRGVMKQPVTRLHGAVIEFIDRSVATTDGWWFALDEPTREKLTEPGLRSLFERFRLVQAGSTPAVPIDSVLLQFFGQLTGALLEPIFRRFMAERSSLPADVQYRALTAGLDPMDDQGARYLVAQGIFEVLSAALFHRLLQDHFSDLEPILRGTSPRKSSTLTKAVTRTLEEATKESGDYEPILLPSPIAVWVLEHAPDDAIPHWISLFGFIDRLDLTAISSDVLGSIFERLISPERRHDMGQHYTQPRLARSMAKWAVRDAEDTVLDPACGAGTFLVETYARHEALGVKHTEILNRTFGNDIDPFAVHLASINLVTRRIKHGLNYPAIRMGDGFDLKPGVSMLHVVVAGSPHDRHLEPVNMVITNPPYARAHPNEDKARGALEVLYPSTTKLPATAGINQAAWFVLLGEALLKNGGRMAFVLPSAVLQNDNLRSWRHWIRQRWDLLIWHTEDDVWFSDARVAPCVILFSPKAGEKSKPGVVHFVNSSEAATGNLMDIDGLPSPAATGKVRDLSSIDTRNDLLIHGTKPDALIAFETARAVIALESLGSVEAGAGQKLGHKFFLLRDMDPDSRAVLRTVEGLGTRFKVNRKHLTPILRGPKQLKSGEYSSKDTWLLSLSPKMPASPELKAYIRLAESQGVHKLPSVAARGKSWWSVEPKLWDVAVPMNAQFQHQVAWLAPPGAATNNFNCLRFDRRSDGELVAASVASAFGALCRLYVSGEVGCEGARRILLSQFQRWPVLDPSIVGKALKAAVVKAYRRFRKLPSYELDQMPMPELDSWRELTVAVARAALGSTASQKDAEKLADAAIREAQTTCARRRRREATALAGRTRGTGASMKPLADRVRKWTQEAEVYAECTDLMTRGSEVSRLREPADIDEMTLFGPYKPLDKAPDKEKILTSLLGAGFEAAWPDPDEQTAELDNLIDRLRVLIRTITIDLLKAAPPTSSHARQSWDTMREQVLGILRKQLQRDVKSALA